MDDYERQPACQAEERKYAALEAPVASDLSYHLLRAKIFALFKIWRVGCAGIVVSELHFNLFHLK